MLSLDINTSIYIEQNYREDVAESGYTHLSFFFFNFQVTFQKV